MARIICFLLFGACLVAAAQEEPEGGKCERIRLPLCQDLGYNWTAMPNLMGHRDQKEAEDAVSSVFQRISKFLYIESHIVHQYCENPSENFHS